MSAHLSYCVGHIVELKEGTRINYSAELTRVVREQFGIRSQLALRGDLKINWPIRLGTEIKNPWGGYKSIRTDELLSGNYKITGVSGLWDDDHQGSKGATLYLHRVMDDPTVEGPAVLIEIWNGDKVQDLGLPMIVG
jgi:hypothetical protein